MITSIFDSNVDPKVFEEMLKFIYTGKLQKHQLIEGLIEGLLVVADKYAIDGLREVCENSLINGIRIKNAIGILQLADSHNAFDLKQQVIQFIVGHAQYIIETDEFKNIGQSQLHLIKELFCGSNDKCSDNETTQEINKNEVSLEEVTEH